MSISLTPQVPTSSSTAAAAALGAGTEVCVLEGHPEEVYALEFLTRGARLSSLHPTAPNTAAAAGRPIHSNPTTTSCKDTAATAVAASGSCQASEAAAAGADAAEFGGGGGGRQVESSTTERSAGSRGGSGAGEVREAGGGGGGGDSDEAEGRPCELLVVGSGESLFLWDLGVGRLMQEAMPTSAAAAPEAGVGERQACGSFHTHTWDQSEMGPNV
jgi:hypothetical protein